MKVVIIGAGVAGLSIGWRLRQAGAEVTVLERAQPGGGATWASAGMIAATAEIETEGAMSRLARRSAELWPDFAHEIEESSGMGVGYRTDGTLIVATNALEADALAKRALNAKDVRFLSADEAHSLEPQLASSAAGALFAPYEAQVDNRALGPALATALQCAGGKLASNEAVVRIEVENGRAAAARTPFNLHRADAFVLAAGAWSSRIEGLPAEATPPVDPVKGEMIALHTEAHMLPSHMIWANDVYMLPRHDRLLIGATLAREGFDTRTTKAAADWLFRQAEATMPALSQWQIVEQWAGLRPGSPDDLPLIGPSALEGLFVASGQFRNGILFAPAIAQSMRDIVLEQALPEPVFDPRRFAGGNFAQ
jgi:glycine oxidase